MPRASPSNLSSILDQSSRLCFFAEGASKASFRFTFLKSLALWFFKEMVIFRLSPGWLLKFVREPLMAKLKSRSFWVSAVVVFASAKVKTLLLFIVESAPEISPEVDAPPPRAAVLVTAGENLPIILNVQLLAAKDVEEPDLFGSIIHLRSLLRVGEEEAIKKFCGHAGFNSSF